MVNVLFTFFACIPLIIHVNNDIILISRLDWNIKLRLIDHTNIPTYPSVSISSFFYKMGDTSNLRAIYFMLHCDYLCVSRNYNVLYLLREHWTDTNIVFKAKSFKYSTQIKLMALNYKLNEVRCSFWSKIYSLNWKLVI